MVNSQESFFYRKVNPMWLSAAVFTVSFTVMLVAQLGEWLRLYQVETTFPWIVAATFILLLSLFNGIFILSADEAGKFFGRSILGYLLTVVFSIIVAYLFSSKTIGEVEGSFKWIFFVLAFAHLIILTIGMLIKRIVQYAQNQDKKLRNED